MSLVGLLRALLPLQHRLTVSSGSGQASGVNSLLGKSSSCASGRASGSSGVSGSITGAVGRAGAADVTPGTPGSCSRPVPSHPAALSPVTGHVPSTGSPDPRFPPGAPRGVPGLYLGRGVPGCAAASARAVHQDLRHPGQTQPSPTPEPPTGGGAGLPAPARACDPPPVHRGTRGQRRDRGTRAQWRERLRLAARTEFGLPRCRVPEALRSSSERSHGATGTP